MDYYRILGISVQATDEEVKRAYRRLALRYHPDKNSSAQAEDRFKEVLRAYEVLSDRGRRELYNLYGEGAPNRGFPNEPPRPSPTQNFRTTGPLDNLYEQLVYGLQERFDADALLRSQRNSAQIWGDLFFFNL